MSDGTQPRRLTYRGDGSIEDERVLDEVAAILLAGGVAAFPTDTVYGLGADQRQPGALGRLYQIKGRPPEKQIALLIADVEPLRALAADVPKAAETLAARFWPGALTLVLPGREGLTIAFRWPDHPVPLGLIRRVGTPLATTSANRSGGPSPRTAQEVLAQLPTGYEALIDGGPCPGGRDSTVLDLSGSRPRILRPGALAATTIAAALGEEIEG